LAIAFALFPSAIFAQPSLKGKPGISKQYAIKSARFADRSYKFAKLSYQVNDVSLSKSSLDSANFFIDESIASMDSAIYFANDSDLIALDLADVSKKYAGKAQKKINMALESKGNSRVELAKDATLLSANAVTDAYHASFYFRGELKKKEAPKNETPKKDSAASKEITKLDVDQSVFTMLNKDLESKISANTKELEKLKKDLSATSDQAKTTKIKGKIKKLEKENVELAAKNNDTKIKLADINVKIEERNKTGLAPKEPELAKGLHFESVEEWNKHILMDTELPPALVYQVQVGVYKNKVLYEIFRGLTPVYGKTTPQGISFAIGIFEKFADANQAKEYVKSIGLQDAFVVAYNNKKKINTADAQKLEKK